MAPVSPGQAAQVEVIRQNLVHPGGVDLSVNPPRNAADTASPGQQEAVDFIEANLVHPADVELSVIRDPLVTGPGGPLVGRTGTETSLTAAADTEAAAKAAADRPDAVAEVNRGAAAPGVPQPAVPQPTPGK
jgi:hypothetical protein